VITTKTAEAEDQKAMTLGELERFIEQARLVGLDGDAKVTATLSWRGSVKKITAVG
jgi:hypothetical protein